MQDLKLFRLDSSGIDPQSLLKKRLVVHFDNRVLMYRVVDVACRQLFVREFGISQPFQRVEEADFEPLSGRQMQWIDLDKLIGVTRLQVFA